MPYRRPDYDPGADDDFAGGPPIGPVPRWAGGVAVPVAVLAYGLRVLLSGHATLAGRGISTAVHGPDAAAIGLAAASAAAFLHCHYFWGNVDRLAPWADVGKAAGLIGLIASLGYLLVHLGILGR